MPAAQAASISTPPDSVAAGAVSAHVAAGALVGCALGLGAVWDAGDGPGGPTWLSAATWSAIGGAVGFFQWLGVAAALRLGAVSRAAAAVRASFADLDHADGASRPRGLFAAATLATGAALLGAFAYVVWRVHGRLETVTVEGLAPLLQAVATLGALGVVAAALLPIAGAVARGLAAVDAVVRLPLPRRPHPHLVAWVVVPLTVGAWLTVDAYRAELGAAAWLLDLVPLAALTGGLTPLLTPLPRLPRRALGGLGAALTLGGATVSALAPTADAAALLAAAHAGSSGVELLRLVTDFDGDGVSALVGGSDCAPFDPDIRPGAEDRPGDGVDSDCDGIDPARPTDGDDEERRVSRSLAPEQRRRYDILVVVQEAVRADHTGLLGYERDTTPHLDALARESLVFTNAHSTSSATRISIPTLLTGRWPSRVDWTRNGAHLDEEALTLPERLQAAGWRTFGWVNRWINGQLQGLGQGFERYDHYMTREFQDTHHAHSGAVLTQRVLTFLGQRTGDEPFFLYLYFEDPHHPYRPREAPNVGFGEEPIDRYDGEIAYVDRQLGVLIEYLRWSKRWDDTIVLVTADHGEEFGEHGGERHARTLFQEVLRIPLLLRVPGLEPATLDAPVSLVDVTPTLLELAGVEFADDELDGRSLLIPALDGDVAPERPLLAELRGQPRTQRLRTLIRGRWKLIRDLTDNELALYDLEADPGETHNVALANPTVLDEMKREMATHSAAR